MPASKVPSADATVPPLLVMKVGALYLLASVISKVWLWEPLFTPNGKPGKVGAVVATSALPPVKKGHARQQWICDAVVLPNRPPKNIHRHGVAREACAQPRAKTAARAFKAFSSQNSRLENTKPRNNG